VRIGDNDHKTEICLAVSTTTATVSATCSVPVIVVDQLNLTKNEQHCAEAGTDNWCHSPLCSGGAFVKLS